MRILVTGASGFLGSNLVRLLGKDFDLKLLVRNIGTSKVETAITLSDFDLISWRPDVVIMAHAAVASGSSQLPNAELFEANVNYTESIVRKFQESHIIYVSSVSVYKIDSGLYNELSVVSPVSAYSISKWWGEQVVGNAVNYTIIRFPSLYGNGMKENTIIPNYVMGALRDRKIKVWGEGKRLQNYLHINDACGYIKAILFGLTVSQKQILLGVSTQSFSNLDLANIIARELAADIEFINQDHSPSYEYENNFSRNLLSFLPNVEFEHGIKQYIEWKTKQ